MTACALDLIKDQGKLRAAMCAGKLEDKARGAAWIAVSGADAFALKHDGLYRRLLQPDCKTSHSAAIGRDLGRTFPLESYFGEGLGQQSLSRVLHAYAVFDRAVGYCQGLGVLAGTLLMHMDEEHAIWTLVSMLSSRRYRLRGVFTPGMPHLKLLFFQLQGCLGLLLPALAAHFDRESVQLSSFAAPWFMTLFVHVLPQPSALHVMDLFFCEGPAALLRVAVAVLALSQKRLLQLSLEQLLAELRRSQAALSPRQLQHALAAVRLPAALLDKLESQFKQSISSAAAASTKSAASFKALPVSSGEEESKRSPFAKQAASAAPT